jgi:UDP-N-acetylglucosamine 4,6-dehydratase/5-epimerase
VFVPKIPSMNIMDLAKAMAPTCQVRQTGIRPGEKVHETLVSEDEARHTLDFDDMYVIRPEHAWWGDSNWTEGLPLPEGFRYSSDNNDRWLTIEEMRELAEDGIEHARTAYQLR